MDATMPIVASAITMGLMDLVWLTVRYDYHEKLFQNVQKSKLTVRWIPAMLIYVLLPIAIYIWAIQKAKTASQAAMNGALVGFILYAFYDLTNYATLNGWTLDMLIVDILWGTILSMVGATAGFYFRQYK